MVKSRRYNTQRKWVTGMYHSQCPLIDKVQFARHLILKHNRVARDNMDRFQDDHERVEKPRFAACKGTPNEGTAVHGVAIVGIGHLYSQ